MERKFLLIAVGHVVCNDPADHKAILTALEETDESWPSNVEFTNSYGETETITPYVLYEDHDVDAFYQALENVAYSVQEGYNLALTERSIFDN